MSSTDSKLAMAKTVLSTAASVAATAMVVRSVATDFLPPEFQNYIFFNLRNFFSRFSSHLTMVIDEFDGLVNNQIYDAANVYLSTKISPTTTHRLKVTKIDDEKSINVSMDRNEEVTDLFDGAKLKWIWLCHQVESKDFYNRRDMNSTLRSEVRSFELTFHKKHKQKVFESYFPYIMKEAKSMKDEKKTVKIFTVDYENMYNLADLWKAVNLNHPATFETVAMDSEMKKIFTVDYENMYNLADLWTAVNLNHPATFETVAMDSEMKKMILEDLERFVNRKDFYRKVGKAWKRGYLLYGPPGTGKSSLIAAMANYLNFDVYDLELTGLRCNSDLRRLLVATANRSILVVEDIDCTIELQDRMALARASQPHGFHQEENKVTLSGLLNFVDGLWSSCGDERIIVFTTNHKDKLDPALLRPGRMDVHIHMSYCTPCGFKLLASNYLGITVHELFGEIEELIQSTEVTPAEVAEQLLKTDDPDATLSGLIDFLQGKRKEKEEDDAKKVVEVESVETGEEKEEQEGEKGGEKEKEHVDN